VTRGRAPPAPRRAAPVGARPSPGRGRGVHSLTMADANDRTPAQTPHRHGFRVEGHRPAKEEPKPQARMPGGRGFWVFLLVLLALNYVIAGLVSSTPSRESVPYSYFRAQVTAGNVSEVTSTGSTIQGTFRSPVKPPGTSGKPSTRFQTERPALGGDGLLKLLEAQGVAINAHPI